MFHKDPMRSDQITSAVFCNTSGGPESGDRLPELEADILRRAHHRIQHGHCRHLPDGPDPRQGDEDRVADPH